MTVMTDIEHALQELGAKVGEWPGVTLVPHRFGGTEFHVGRATLGRTHSDGVVDVSFPREARDALLRSAWPNAPRSQAESAWVSFAVIAIADIAPAIRLLRRAYEVLARTEASSSGAAESPRDPVDEAGEESFPASDPPAFGGKG